MRARMRACRWDHAAVAGLKSARGRPGAAVHAKHAKYAKHAKHPGNSSCASCARVRARMRACACDHFTAVAWSADSRDCTALSAAVVSRNDLMLHRADRSPQTLTAEHWLADPAGLGPSAVRSGLGQSAVRSDHAAVAGLQTARGRPCAAAHCPLLDSPAVRRAAPSWLDRVLQCTRGQGCVTVKNQRTLCSKKQKNRAGMYLYRKMTQQNRAGMYLYRKMTGHFSEIALGCICTEK